MEGGSGARWTWIVNRRADLAWFIGSALVGFLYLGLVWWLGRDLTDPMRDPFARLSLLGHRLELTLGLVVVASWAILLDAPHLFATLARTYLDPDEWRTRRTVLLIGLLWFGVGPVVLLLPLMLGASAAKIASAAFLVLFRMWAYYHVVRQHWGFVMLYRRKAGETREARADAWFFCAMMWLPMAMFLTAPWYGESGYPSFGLDQAILGSLTPAAILHPLTLGAYAFALLAYVVLQAREWRRSPRNGAKLLLLTMIAPLHLVAFASPLFVLFVVPIVTVGHNLQYHRLVWMYGRNKYLDRSRSHGVARWVFRSAWLYVVLGLGFTLALYRGPWIELVKGWLAGALERGIVPALGAIGGIDDPAALEFGARVAAALFLGWAMQHYYLDARIWRLSRDREVAKVLAVG